MRLEPISSSLGVNVHLIVNTYQYNRKRKEIKEIKLTIGARDESRALFAVVESPPPSIFLPALILLSL